MSLTRTIARRNFYNNNRQTLFGIVSKLPNAISWLQAKETTGSFLRNSLSTYYNNPSADLFGGAGTFDSATGWTVPSAWSISGGEAHYDDSATQDLIHNVSTPISTGDTLRLTFDTSDSPGSARFDVRNLSANALISAANYANGSHSIETFSLNDAPVGIRIRGINSQSAFDLDNFFINITGQADASIANVTLGADGKLAAADAATFNGSTSVGTMTRPILNGMTTFSYWLRINPDVLGANDYLIYKQDEFELFINSSSGDIRANVHCASTDATVTTDTGFLSIGEWQDIFVSYDDTTKVIHIYKAGIEATYAANTTGVGDRVSNTNSILIGKDSGANGYNGDLDDFLVTGGLITPSKMVAISNA